MVNDFVKKVDGLKQDIQSFYVSPTRWDASRVAVSLKWEKIKFEAGNASKAPDKRGIYAFIVQRSNGHFPDHGFIMYIGITGERSKERTLQDRFKDYLSEKKRNKRPRVHYMLNKWEDDLYFYYVPIDDKKFNLAQLEIDLNDAIIPPKGVKDFSVEIKQLRDALQ